MSPKSLRRQWTAEKQAQRHACRNTPILVITNRPDGTYSKEERPWGSK